MTRIKDVQSRKIKNSGTKNGSRKSIEIPEDNDEKISISPKKIKSPMEIEEVDTVVDLDEKITGMNLPSETEEESEVEDLTLDEEELNPFGDKWEQ